MQQHRKALADLLRPRLRPPGFNDAEFRRKFDRLLDAAGVPRDEDPIAPALPGHGLGVPLDPEIATIDVELLRVACPQVGRELLAAFVEPVRRACQAFEIDTIRRVAAFIAQIAHESCCFTAMNENLNYSSAKRIHDIFGRGEAGRRRFPSLAHCTPYVGQPQKLANYVYANRMGNGPPESGDGWRYRGGGGIGLTGADNWNGFAAAMGMPVDQALAWARTPEGGIMAAAWFWEVNDINRLADTPGVTDESRRINGGDNGLDDRKAKFDRLVEELLRRERAAAVLQ
jgi:putative chitinase